MRRKHRWKRLKAESVDLDTEAASEKRGGLFMNMCFRAGEAIALFYAEDRQKRIALTREQSVFFGRKSGFLHGINQLADRLFLRAAEG